MKILVVYATAGAGHRKAAEALAHAFKSSGSLHTVVLLDSLDQTNPFFKKAYPTSYTMLITWAPALWGFFFALLDLPLMRPFVAFGRRIYNGLNAAAFQKYLIRENFDYIISTHFLGTEVSAALKRSGKITSKIITVVTDFDVHSIWLAKGVDFYTVATEFTKEKIISLGVLPQQVFVTGIPTHENFSKTYNPQELRIKMGLKNDAFTVLLATGSFGIGPIEQIIRELDSFQVVVICGHNKKLFDRLSAIKSDSAKIFGLVNNMHEMMALSDVMITKPGGLSICEALVTGLPMIFFNAIPGQETNNIRVLAHYGVGLSGLNVSEMPSALRKMKDSPSDFAQIKARTKALARPNAARDIIALIR